MFTVVAMNLQDRNFYWQHSSDGTLALAFNLWAVFGATTLFNLPPSKCSPKHLLEQMPTYKGSLYYPIWTPKEQ